jgi:hypothetical protein
MMNTPYKGKTVGHSKSGCCEETKCESGLRNKYFIGKRLSAESFRVEQRYGIDRRHLLNRAIHGWGVVYGFKISADAGQLTIGEGLALDTCGRELVLSETSIGIDEQLIVLDEKSKYVEPEDRPGFFANGDARGRWVLSVHYAEKPIEPVTVPDSCTGEHQEWDRMCETVRFSLQQEKHSGKRCCESFDCSLNCKCGTCCEETHEPPQQPEEPGRGYADTPGTPTYQAEEQRVGYATVQGEAGYRSEPPEPQPTAPQYGTDQTPAPEEGDDRGCKAAKHGTQPPRRGGCRCLCEHLTELTFDTESCHLCPIEEHCGTVDVDFRNGVPIACVDIAKGECDWEFGTDVEDCGPRRLVKRNDLLFDLIRGCDLTRIESIGWADWHRSETTYEKFDEAFGPAGYGKPEYLADKFCVRFTRPVRAETLRPDCFSMTVLSREQEGGWIQTQRVPIHRLEYITGEPDDPANHVRGARLVIAGDWVEDALRGRARIFRQRRTRVEVEIRGDFIVDCNGQTVDANAIGLSGESFGNGSPGGTFLSTFRVAKKLPDPDRRDSADSGEWSEGE